LILNLVLQIGDSLLKLKQELQTSLLALMKPFIPRIVSFRKIWKNSVYQFSLGTGYIQLVKSLVLLKDDSILYNGDIITDIEESAVDLMLLLANIFEGEECYSRLKVDLSDHVKGKGSNTSTWDTFFTLKGGLNKYEIAQDGPLIKFIKATMKECLQPAIQELKTLFSEKFPFKSVIDSWKINVDISENVIIHHTDIEESKEENVDGFFTFDWEVIFEFKNLTCEELYLKDMGIIDITFHSETSKETKYELQTTLGSFTKSGSFRTTITSMNAQELLQLCISQLRKNNVKVEISEQQGTINGMKIVDLLECLYRSIFSMEIKVVVPTHNSSQMTKSRSQSSRR